jgi:hypothetical protein
MSNYGRAIGDAMVMLAVVLAFAIPFAIFCAVGLAFASFGFTTVGPVLGALGLIAGTIAACAIAINT